MPSEQELKTMRDEAQDALFTAIRRLEDRHGTLDGKVDIMASVMVTKMDFDELKGKINALLSIQNTIMGTKTFAGWIKDGVKYVSIVGGGIAAALHFGLQFLHNINGVK